MKYQILIALTLLVTLAVSHHTGEKHHHEAKAVHAHPLMPKSAEKESCACTDITAIRCAAKSLKQKLLRLKNIANAQKPHDHAHMPVFVKPVNTPVLVAPMVVTEV
jgi:hypothetical protein